MKRPDEEFAVLLDGINGIEAGMVRSLLEAEGIPSLKHAPDFDVAEFGQAAHDMLRGTSLLVPHDALRRARALLGESGWDRYLEDEVAVGTAVEESPATFGAVLRTIGVVLAAVLIGLVLTPTFLSPLVLTAILLVACAVARPLIRR